jgi:hypothetical protein
MPVVTEAQLRTALAQTKDRRFSPKPTVKAFGSLEASLREAIDSRRKALQQLATVRPVHPRIPVELNEPFLIWVDPSTLPGDTPSLPSKWDYQIVPGASWVKIYINDSANLADLENRGGQVDFYFMWQNPSAYLATINVSTSLIIKGEVQVSSDQGTLSGDNNTVQLSSQLSLIEWWNQPPTYPFPEGSQRVDNIVYLSATGGSIFGGSDIKAVNLFNAYDMSYSIFSVPPNGVAIFEVQLLYSYHTHNGNVTIELYGTDQLNYYVMCPFVFVDVLTSPGVVGTEQGASKGAARTRHTAG